MQIHGNATTNKKQRELFRRSRLSTRALAHQCQVSHTTVATWKKRPSAEDRSCAPKTRRYALTGGEQDLVLFLRQHKLSLDEVTAVVVGVLPAANRSNVYRVLKREGVNQVPRPPREKRGTYKAYAPGFVHIDCFYLPALGGKKRYCFVAVDRATRLAYLQVYDRRTQEVVVDFLRCCRTFFPFRIEKILTDNGGEFMRIAPIRHGRRALKRPHTFGSACKQAHIEHRTTRMYSPWTNGLVERMNGLMQQQTIKRYVYPHHAAIEAALQDWLVCYNCYRRHRLLDYRTPYQAVCDWYETHPDRFLKDPTHVLTCLGVNNDMKLDS